MAPSADSAGTFAGAGAAAEPAARNARAAEADIRANSRQLMPTHVPSRKLRSIGRSGHCRAR